jgi:hypothetical protein
MNKLNLERSFSKLLCFVKRLSGLEFFSPYRLPPALSWLTVNAFTTSESIIVVVSPGYFELDSLMQINKTLQKIQRFFNPGLKLKGYLFTMN